MEHKSLFDPNHPARLTITVTTNEDEIRTRLNNAIRAGEHTPDYLTELQKTLIYTDVPYLLTEVARLQAEVTRLRAELAEWQQQAEDAYFIDNST
jgi:uncharacterized small protein (DUF1192 family)